MKSLIVFRHAKSDWRSEAGSDHARPLNERGRVAAAAMGRFLAQARQAPERAITSSAFRARTTLEIACESGEWGSEVHVTDDLYETMPPSVLELVQSQDEDADSILLCGHEPTCSTFVALLTGGGRFRFPTAAMAKVDLPVASWSRVRFEVGELAWFVPPKLFTRGSFRFC